MLATLDKTLSDQRFVSMQVAGDVAARPLARLNQCGWSRRGPTQANQASQRQRESGEDASVMRYVQVINATTGETLAERAELAETFLTRFLGLQGRKELPEGEGLVLAPTNSIHMFFMRFAIDAIFIDEAQRVTRVGRRLRPWTIGPLAPGALYCIELPAGRAERTQPGHEITLRPLGA